MTGRRPTTRVLVTPPTAEALEPAHIQVMARLGRKVSKTDFADAVIRAGLTDLDAVAALLEDEPRA